MFGIFSKHKRDAADLLIPNKAEAKKRAKEARSSTTASLLGRFISPKENESSHSGTGSATGAAADPKINTKKRQKQAGKDLSSPGTSDLVSIGKSNDVLVFGMRWRTLVTSGTTRDGLMKMAMKEGATHFIRQRQQIGYCQLPPIEPGMTLFPAALLAAKNHAGDALYVLNTAEQEGHYWVARTRGGHPTSLDEFIVGTQDLLLERVRSLVTEGDANEILIFTNISDITRMPNVREFSVQDLFDIARSVQESLQPVVKPKRTFPKPVRYALLTSLLVLCGQSGYRYWSEYKAAEAKRLSKSNQLTPEEAWAPIIQKFESNLNASSLSGMQSVRDEIYKAPVIWSGWQLRTVKCKVNQAQVVASSVNWACVAEYQRGRIALNNKEMEALIGTKWKPKFIDIGLMQVAWDLKVDRVPMRIGDLQDHVQMQIASVSAIQELLPALSTPPTMVFKLVELVPPKNEQGMAIPKPDSFPNLYQMPVSIKGPLRSIEAVIEATPNVDWNTFDVAYVGGLDRGASAGLVATSFVSEISGVAYAK
jgi:hypothetical protein